LEVICQPRATAGFCVLCELCYRVVFGSEQGDWAAAELARQRRRAA